MSPSHHPGAQVLADLLVGECSPGAALLVARHVAACPQCTARLNAMGAVTSSAGEISYDPPQTERPGIEIARARGASGLGEAVFWVRAQPGEALPLEAPLHVHELLVLEGGFTAHGLSYFAGDFLSLTERPVREAISDRDHGCIILATCEDGSGTLAE
jgi:anti-sigma factor ChrR (cupin superfamily)